MSDKIAKTAALNCLEFLSSEEVSLWQEGKIQKQMTYFLHVV